MRIFLNLVNAIFVFMINKFAKNILEDYERLSR